jgi:hypothetical protein
VAEATSDGALVSLTHDRYLLDRVSTVVLGLDGRGGAQLFADYWQWEQAKMGQGDVPKAAKQDSASPKSQPSVFDQDVDEEAFDDAEGLELVGVLGGESGENGGVFAGGGFVSGVDAGLESVPARDGFTLLGARTGGELSIRAIGVNLFLGCHRTSATTVAGAPGRIRAVGREVIEGERKKMFE